MAEGVLGGMLGDEEGPEAEAAQERVSAEAFASALAADHAKYDPAVAREAADFLRDQAALLREQTAQIRDERALRLSHLQGQSREGRLRWFGLQIRLGMQIFVALIATVVGAGLLAMFYGAVTSQSVVVDTFDAPAGLAARGVTGVVVASGVLDALEMLQDATRSTVKGLKTTSAWSSDIKIEVPQTGVSIGEIDRVLHDRFGHDVHIGGELVQTVTGGLALTVRGDGVPARMFSGGADDLGALTTKAAEYVYGRSQPYRYATYLMDAGRFTELLAFLPRAQASAVSAEQRARLAVIWGAAFNGVGKFERALSVLRAAMTLVPRDSDLWWVLWDNIGGVMISARGEEAAWREGMALLTAASRLPPRNRPSDDFNAASNTWDLPLYLDLCLKEAGSNGGAGALSTNVAPTIADIYALMHDPDGSARAMASSDPDDPTSKAEALLLAGYAALASGDGAAAVPPLEAFAKAWAGDPNLQTLYPDDRCFLGLAYGLAGRREDAEAAFRTAGAWSRCYAMHGDVLVHEGDVAAAERVWADGLKVGPDLPFVYLHRGSFEFETGDLKDAERDFSIAHEKAPHFADPLKAWGDLLASEGRWQQARAKYDEALHDAPDWKALKQAMQKARRFAPD